MFCSQCGSEISENSRFCGLCGHNLVKDLPASVKIPVPVPVTARRFEPSYAGFWLRFLAFIIDMILLTFCLKFLGGILEGVSGSYGYGGFDSFFGNYFLVWFLLYYSIFESTDFRGTPGKRALGMHVLDLNGKRLTLLRALARNFCKLFSFCAILVGFIIAGITARKQALHDLIAGCLVVL
ncbi:MAG: RDD family protein [Candidatus Wallbacteria bacterium]|nr:RDD family protein [Candidatus Wallbacteria bacterium]